MDNLDNLSDTLQAYMVIGIEEKGTGVVENLHIRVVCLRLEVATGQRD